MFLLIDNTIYIYRRVISHAIFLIIRAIYLLYNNHVNNQNEVETDPHGLMRHNIDQIRCTVLVKWRYFSISNSDPFDITFGDTKVEPIYIVYISSLHRRLPNHTSQRLNVFFYNLSMKCASFTSWCYPFLLNYEQNFSY